MTPGDKLQDTEVSQVSAYYLVTSKSSAKMGVIIRVIVVIFATILYFIHIYMYMIHIYMIIYAYAYTYQDTLAFLAVAFSLKYSAIPLQYITTSVADIPNACHGFRGTGTVESLDSLTNVFARLERPRHLGSGRFWRHSFNGLFRDLIRGSE